ncbi:MAG: hypothetical protein KF868_16895 [Acidobacteria bacterium]|nr:hypothetical protein [Acidobacteriota bacterium]MCW5971268.1 hypothetical protein [Blastocatellales bacterium]
MSWHLSGSEIERFHNRSGSGAELSGAAQHLGECQACREIYRELVSRTGKLSLALGAGGGFTEEHPEYETKAGYAAGEMDEQSRAWVDAHMEVCAACKSDMEAFIAERARRSSELEVRYIPGGRKNAPAPEWGWRRAAAFIAAACGAAALLILLGLEWRGRDAGLQARLSPEVPASGETGSEETETVEIATSEEASIAGSAKSAAAGRDSLTDSERALIAAARRGRMEMPESISGLAARRGVLRGNARSAAASGLLSPRQEAVAEERPVFRWRRAAGATGYRVYVMDAEARIITSSPRLPADTVEWRAESALEGGREYLWALGIEREGVESVAPAPGRGEARFLVLGARERKAVDEWSRRIASPFARGVLYARAGVISEAEREWRRAATDKEQAGEARRLLDLLRSWR